MLLLNELSAGPAHRGVPVTTAPRICLITSGHLSTCPRMLKAADSLAEAGYAVRVVSANSTPWASETDRSVRASRSWSWTRVDHSRESAPGRRLWCGMRFRGAGLAARWWGPRRCPIFLAARACSRAHTELVRAALAEPADLFYGGTTGALAAVAVAAHRAGKPYALDLEDFHSNEQAGSPAAEGANAIAERIETRILHRAVFLTAGSDAITRAYREKYGVRPTTINNTFRLPQMAPDFSNLESCLRLYWFSQTIGPRRGLEDVIRALGIAGVRGELHLRGRPAAGYLDSLQLLAAECAPLATVVHHEPGAPDEMIDLCRGYDCGLSLEPGFCLNNELALSNKVLTYTLAGLALVLTDTPGQRPLVKDLADNALVYSPGDVHVLAAGLRQWAEDRDVLRRARIASWEAAQRRWHWEHPLERGALLELVSEVLGRRTNRTSPARSSAGTSASI